MTKLAAVVAALACCASEAFVTPSLHPQRRNPSLGSTVLERPTAAEEQLRLLTPRRHEKTTIVLDKAPVLADVPPLIVESPVLEVKDLQPTTAAATTPAAASKTTRGRRRRPSRELVAKCVTFGLTYAAADVTAQLFALFACGATVPLLDALRRTASLALVGTFAVGPLLAFWFDLLERLVPGRKAKAIATRTALDQAIQVPFCIAMIFTLSALAEGHGLAFCLAKIDDKLLSTWRDCLGVWVPVQFINQGLVPLRYRVLFQAIVSFFWDTYLSIVAHA